MRIENGKLKTDNCPDATRRSERPDALQFSLFNFHFSIPLSLVAGLFTALWAGADTVQTISARLEGRIELKDGGLQIAGATVPLNDVVAAVRDTGANTISAVQSVRMSNGEIWFGSILGLETNTLAFRGDLFGERAIGTESVATLDFSRQTAPTTPSKRGVLYRESGEPIPGTLLWLREHTLAIDCPLGVLPIPRQGVIRYQFKAPVNAVPRAGEDELGLIDGSVFRGRLSLVSNGVDIAHASLDRISVPWAAVRYLQRSPPGLMRLGLPTAGDVEARGPAGAPESPRLLDYRTGLEPRQPSPACLTAVRVQPVTAAHYRLQGREGRKAWFHAVATPVPDCRSEVRISLQVAGAPAYERTLAGTNSPVAVSIELPPGEELTLKTDFGGKLLFPCGVDWQDPCVVFRKE